MIVRFIMSWAVVALFSVPAAEWYINIDDVIVAREIAENDRVELDDYLRQLRGRLYALRSQRLTAKALDRIAVQDEAFLKAEIEQTALVRGGEVLVGSTRVWISGQRMRIEGEELLILDGDRAEGRQNTPEGWKTLALQPAMTPITLPATAAISGGRVTWRWPLDDQRQITVVLRVDQPNPFAVPLPAVGVSALSNVIRLVSNLPYLPERIDITGLPSRALIFTSTTTAAVAETLLTLP